MRRHNNMHIRKHRQWVASWSTGYDPKEILGIYIRCNYPYLNTHWSRKIVRAAMFLPPETLFAITDELCRLPGSFQSRKPFKRYAWKQLNRMPRYFSHPLLPLIIDTGNHQCRGINFTDEETMRRMNIVRPYKLFYALETVFQTCTDEDGKVDELWDAIMAEWNAA